MSFIAASAALAGALTMAADLNAPIVQKPPTVGAEISRGHDAARSCGERFNPVEQLLRYEGCIDATHDANRQELRSGFEPFDTGLYFEEKRALVNLARILGSKDPFGTRAITEAGANLADARYSTVRDVLGLTDDQVRQASFGLE